VQVHGNTFLVEEEGYTLGSALRFLLNKKYVRIQADLTCTASPGVLTEVWLDVQPACCFLRLQHHAPNRETDQHTRTNFRCVFASLILMLRLTPAASSIMTLCPAGGVTPNEALREACQNLKHICSRLKEDFLQETSDMPSA